LRDAGLTIDEALAVRIIAITSRQGKRHLTLEEFVTLCTGLRVFGELVSIRDRDRISLESLEHGLTKSGIQPSEAHVRRMFALADTNNDGTLDLEEFLKVYLSSPTHVDFVQSWYLSGRNRHHVHAEEISPKDDFIAGTFAGVAIILVSHPFDTIKVRLQTLSPLLFRGSLDCLRKTIRGEGFLGLYKGSFGPLLTTPLLNAIVFGSYGLAKRWIEVDDSRPLTIVQHGLAGAFGGFANSIISGPVEYVKTQLQIQQEVKVYRGQWDCLRNIVATTGFRGIFRGLTSTICREVPGYGGQFATYEYVKRQLTPHGKCSDDIGALGFLFAGGLGAVVGWTFCYPFDVCKSKIQAESFTQPSKYKKNRYLLDGGLIDCARQTYKQESIRGFWRGYVPCVVSGFPANAAGFLVYEAVVHLLQKSTQQKSTQQI